MAQAARAVHRKTAMSDGDLEEFFDFQRSRTADLPNPAPLIENLTRSVIEIVMGVREVEQVARWVSESTYRHLVWRSVSSRRARALRKQPVKRYPFTIGTVQVCHPADGIVEACTIVHSTVRTRAVVMRLEALDGRWRATTISVL